MKDKRPFAEKHPRLYFLFGLILLLLLSGAVIFAVQLVLTEIGKGVIFVIDYVKKIVSVTDKVIIVALITGIVSIVGVVISSIIAKIVDYRYNVKKYLYDKREEPYTKFIEMVYTIMEDVKKEESEQLTEEDKIKMISEFSKGLTLWGSNRVVKKWLNYRKAAQNQNNPQIIFELEDIIYEIRRDIGLKRRLKKGDMLSFFINDIDKLKDLMKKILVGVYAFLIYGGTHEIEFV